MSVYRIYHITHRADWLAAQQQDEYRTPSLESDGFIHFSTAQQVLKVANAFYRGQQDLVLLEIELSRLQPELKWEPPVHPSATDAPPSDAELFPHLYGPLNLDAVLHVHDLPCNADGTFTSMPD